MKYLIALCLSLVSTISSAKDTNHRCNAFDGLSANENITKENETNPKTKERFIELLTQVSKPYYQTVKNIGATLKVTYDWNSEVVNAQAIKFNNNWEVYFHGGMYRLNLTTDDSMALVICHELGHLIGGAPFYPDKDYQSVEGQADYWATSVCLKRYFQEYPKAVTAVSPRYKAKCDNEYSDNEERNICYRTTNASITTANFFARNYVDKNILPDPDKNDANVTIATANTHPLAQCRMDTYMAGTLCRIDQSQNDFLENNFLSKLTTNLTCASKNGDQVDKRPACWFNQYNNTFVVDYLPSKIKSKSIFGLKDGYVILTYRNHLPGKYKFTIIPDEDSDKIIEIKQSVYEVSLPAASVEGYNFRIDFKFLKKANKKITLKQIVEFDGKVIYTDKNEISTY